MTSRTCLASVALAFLACLAAGGVARAEDPSPADVLAAARKRVRSIQKDLVNSLAKVSRSSVAVRNKRFRRDKQGKRTGEPVTGSGGSGVIVSRRGKKWVVTNHHVIQGAEALTVVTSDGRERDVTLHDTVRQYDIALLKFTDDTADLTAVPILNKKQTAVTEGQWVMATGNPFFLGNDGECVGTLGVVSGLERVVGGRFLYGSAIQHDAEVNPGNSGGPLWTLEGDLVGINGMIAVRDRGGSPTSTGTSFSIPVYQILPFIEAMVSSKKDARSGFLGLVTTTNYDGKGRPDGALVVDFRRGSPCRRGSKALQKNDVVLKFTAGRKPYRIRTSNDLVNALVLYPAGTDIVLKVRRSSKVFDWKGKLADGG